MPAHSFSLVAPFYDQLSQLVFGRAIKQAQMVYLNQVPAGARILLIGGGTGWILPALLEQTACRHVLFLEASDKMLAKARQSVAGRPDAGKVSFRLGTEADIGKEEKFEVVMTFFFLDLFAAGPLNALLARLSQALLPGGLWLVSDFVRPQGSFLRQALAQTLFNSMYLFFRLTCGISAHKLPYWENALSRLHLKSVNAAYFYHGLIKAAVYRQQESLGFPALP